MSARRAGHVHLHEHRPCPPACTQIALARRILSKVACIRGCVVDAALCPWQVVELGQVGRAADASGQARLYVHSQQGADFGNTTSMQDAVVAAAAATSEAQVMRHG